MDNDHPSPEDIDQIDMVTKETETILPVKDTTAHVIAEDIVEREIPSVASREVEMERIARANAASTPNVSEDR